MGVLAPGSAHARPSAQPPIDMSGNFPAHVYAESPSKFSKKPKLRHDTLVGSPESVHDIVTHEFNFFLTYPTPSAGSCYPLTQIEMFSLMCLKSHL